ncbi:MAG: aminotransferase class I/II-fold pyridoxal phosphate-dependent enzyme, partial [Lachnospiraceae bacterium]|nr:aminotransferase class I/II-fold pyridoxal phosphate-dependent enzyme [Lachnospiraceae bacterium]
MAPLKNINFNNPPVGRNSIAYIGKVVKNQHISGDGEFTFYCNEWIELLTKTKKCLLTTSCTHALEMSAFLCGIKAGDEVIMPSYTFVSTANAFALRGAEIVFIDIRPDTMNMDENLLEAAITERTKAIIPVHYAGVSCEMNKIMEIAKRHGIFVIEDAAQGIMSTYYGNPLGALGDFGCFSFHETKNFSMGEGGALLLNDERYIAEAEIIR